MWRESHRIFLGPFSCTLHILVQIVFVEPENHNFFLTMSETRELSRDVKEYFVYASFVQGMNKNANNKLCDYKIFANIFHVRHFM